VSLVYEIEGGQRCVDCQRCGQAARVDRRGNGHTVTCFGGCAEIDAEAMGPAVMRELGGSNGNGAGTEPGGSTLVGLETVVARPVRWAWQDRVALAKITALAGRPKIGKGLLYSDLIAQVTRGALEGDLDDPRDVILVTTEDDPGDTLKPRLMAADADLSRVSMFQMGSPNEPVPFRVPQDAAELSRRVAEKRAALVVIDPLIEFIDGKVDSYKSHPVRQAVAALNQIAREHGCGVLVVFHLNKGVSTDPLLRHEGSAAFTQVVRGGLMVGHDPDDPDGEDGRQRVLAVSSSNLAAIAPSLRYEISTARVMGDTGEEIVTARVACTGESAAGAHDLLRGHPDEEEQTGTDEAEAMLAEELAEGARPADKVIKQARQLGISDKQLRRARGRLGLESTKTGFQGGWEWSLPKPPHRRRPSNSPEQGHLGRLRDQERDCGSTEPPEDAQGAPRWEGASSEPGLVSSNGHQPELEDYAEAEIERLRAKFGGAA
jgi:hypothetical protein